MELFINDRIRNRKIQFFNDFSLSLKYDAMASQFSFKFYFNPDIREHIEVACIGHYHLCKLYHDGELILTGQILSEAFVDGPETQLVAIGGYSLPGVLDDCEIPPSLYPLQSDLLSLREIASKYIKPFGIEMVVDSSVARQMDEVYEESTANAGQSIKSFLSELASQKNIVISHNAKGQLLFTRPSPNQKPVIDFSPGIPATQMSLSFNGQGMHSRIYAINQTDIDDINTSESFVDNPFVLPRVFRQKVSIQNSEKIDTLQSAKNMRAQELKNLQLGIVTDRWQIDGKILRPGQIITAKNPKVYLFKKTRWVIEEIELTGNSTRTTAAIKCVPPSVYDGTEPVNIFAGINQH